MNPVLWTGQLSELTLLVLASGASVAVDDSGIAAVEVAGGPPARTSEAPRVAPPAGSERGAATAAAQGEGSVLESLERVADAIRGEAAELDAAALSEGSSSDQAVRQLLASHLDRDAEQTLEDLRWLPGDLDAMRGSVVRALGESRDVRSLDWISAQLDDPDLVGDALIEIARLARDASEPVRAELRGPVRSLLDDGDAQLRRLARSAAIALLDEEAAPVLVELIACAEGTELEQLQCALEALTGVPRPPLPAGWFRWLDGELAWSGANSARVLGDLEGRDAARTAAAIHELSARTYQRARWSRAIGEIALDDRRSPELRRMAVLALRQLGSPAAQPILTELLSAPGTGKAHDALNALAETVLAALGG